MPHHSKIAACLLTILLVLAQTSSARATTVRLSVDNFAGVYVGSADASDIVPISPTRVTGPTSPAASFSFPSRYQYLYIAAWSDASIQQGLLAEVQLGTDATVVIPSGFSAWRVFATGATRSPSSAQPTKSEMAFQIAKANYGLGPSAGWVPVTVGGPNNGTFPPSNPWGTISGINSISRWMWYDSGRQTGGDTPPFQMGFNHDEFLIFRLPLAQCAPLIASMDSWWTFDSSLAPDQFSIDRARGVHIAEKVNGPLSVPGIVGAAIDLNGSNQYLRVQGLQDMQFAPIEPFSIEGWIWPDSVGENKTIVDSADQLDIGYWLNVQPGGRVEFVIKGLGSPNALETTAPIPANQWVHIAATTGALFGQMRIYVNGALASPVMTRTIADIPSGSEFTIGRYTQGGPFYYGGLLDELKVYSSELSANQVGAIYAAGALGVCSTDCNMNGRQDAIDIANGFSPDTDMNGVPDECDCECCFGDANCDGVVNFMDISIVLAYYGSSCNPTH